MSKKYKSIHRSKEKARVERIYAKIMPLKEIKAIGDMWWRIDPYIDNMGIEKCLGIDKWKQDLQDAAEVFMVYWEGQRNRAISITALVVSITSVVVSIVGLYYI